MVYNDIIMTPLKTAPFLDRLLILLIALFIVLSTTVCIDEMQMARTARKSRKDCIDETILDEIDQEFADLVKRAQEEMPDLDLMKSICPPLTIRTFQSLRTSASQSRISKKGFRAR